MVDDLGVLELQRHEALVAARERLLGRRADGLLDLGLGLLRRARGAPGEKVVGATRDGGCTAGVERRVGAAALGGGLGGVAAGLLLWKKVC